MFHRFHKIEYYYKGFFSSMRAYINTNCTKSKKSDNAIVVLLADTDQFHTRRIATKSNQHSILQTSEERMAQKTQTHRCLTKKNETKTVYRQITTAFQRKGSINENILFVIYVQKPKYNHSKVNKHSTLSHKTKYTPKQNKDKTICHSLSIFALSFDICSMSDHLTLSGVKLLNLSLCTSQLQLSLEAMP